MKFKTSKAIKRLLCIMLVTGMVFTGFPKTLWHNAESGIVNVQAAEEGWKTDIKTALDKVTTFDIDKYSNSSIYLVDLSKYSIPKANISTVNNYLSELADTADYYWVNYITSDPYGTDYVKYVFYNVKSEYVDKSSNYAINKTKAKTDYETFHKRLENGEAFNIVQERVQAAIDNTLRITDYENGIVAYWTGFYVTDLKIPYSQMGDLIAYLNRCSMNDEYTFWCTFTPHYDTNEQYITYIQLDANEACVDKDSIELDENGKPSTAKIDKTKVKSAYKDFQKRISSLTYAVDKNMSDVEKVLLVHDWIAREIDYDYDNYRSNSIPNTSYSAYGAITTGKAVCSGYARLANVLLNGLGVKTQSITSSDMNHEWNAVCINGHYYHMDITWDDLGKDESNEGAVYHPYFLYNDNDFKNEKGHYGWTGVVCDGTDSFSNMIFRDNADRIISYNYYNGYWYYINNDKIYKSTIDGSKKEDIVTDKRVYNMHIYGDHMYYTTYSSSSSGFSTKVWDMNLENGTETLYMDLSNDSDFQDGVQELSIKNGVLKIDGTSKTITKTLPDIPEKTTSQILYGDVNDDGKIDSRDAVELKKYLANFGNYINKDAADVNCDGKIRTSDAVRLLRYLAKDKVTLGAA